MRRRNARLLFWSAFSLVFLVGMVEVVPSGTITPDGAVGPDDQFGRAVAVAGGSVLVGLPNQPSGPDPASGAAQIFEENASGAGYDFLQTVSPASSQPSQRYGRSVAIDGFGGWAAVGVPFDDTPSAGQDAGSVRILRRDGTGSWSDAQTLNGVPEAAQARFGWAMSMDADRLAVGAPGHTNDRGHVHVFKRISPPCSSCWSDESGPLQHPEPANGDEFGTGVDLACGRMVVGAPDRDFFGAAYVYTYDLDGTATWDLDQVLPNPDPVPGGKFGGSEPGGVAVTCDYVAVATSPIGKVFVFRTADYAIDATLTDPASSGGAFGAAIDLSGDRLVIATPNGTNVAGAVDYYRREGSVWRHLATFTEPNPSEQTGFGTSVKIDENNVLLIGAPFENTVYHVDLDDWTPAPVPLMGPAGRTLLSMLIAAVGLGFARKALRVRT